MSDVAEMHPLIMQKMKMYVIKENSKLTIT